MKTLKSRLTCALLILTLAIPFARFLIGLIGQLNTLAQ
jgi:hypothetical protein